jgi:hypothetical protein
LVLSRGVTVTVGSIGSCCVSASLCIVTRTGLVPKHALANGCNDDVGGPLGAGVGGVAHTGTTTPLPRICSGLGRGGRTGTGALRVTAVPGIHVRSVRFATSVSVRTSFSVSCGHICVCIIDSHASTVIASTVAAVPTVVESRSTGSGRTGAAATTRGTTAVRLPPSDYAGVLHDGVVTDAPLDATPDHGRDSSDDEDVPEPVGVQLTGLTQEVRGGRGR